MKNYFSLINCKETKEIINKIIKQKIDVCIISEYETLTFVKLIDDNYSSYLTRDAKFNSINYNLIIFSKANPQILIRIKIELIDTIYNME